MPKTFWVVAIALAVVPPQSPPSPAPPSSPSDTTLAAFGRLVGRWVPGNPQRRDRVVHDYSWAVGQMALHLREGFPLDHPEEAALQGLLYWHPGLQQFRFVAVAGHGPGQGRVFEGEYRLLADDTIERVYDVYYRSLADMPGEEFGGNRRRYREIYRWVTADSVEAQLDWWRDGRWQPFGPGVYRVVRVPGS